MTTTIRTGSADVADLEQTLSLASGCVLAAVGPRGPVSAPSPFWWDGAALWVPGSPASGVVMGWRADPGAAALVVADAAEGHGVLVRGRARVYGPHDPVALALHGPAVGAAAGALALKHPSLLAGYLRDLPRLPASQWPAGLSVARVAGEDVEAVAFPEADGLAPALPGVVPSRVRRALAGRRDVVLATADGDPGLRAATWSAGMRLRAAEGLADHARVVAVVADGAVGLALEGEVVGGCLVASRARWWEGLVSGAVDVPDPVPGGIELPD